MSEQPKLVYFRSPIDRQKVDLFFTYWDNLKIAISMPKDQFEKIGQEIRSAILTLLAKGIPDVNPLTGQTQKRHVLSVNEIKEHIEFKLEKEIQKPNLYFHLNYLEELGLIRVVDTYGKARNVSSYYGRTAKMYLLGEEKTKEDLQILKNENFMRFVQRINTDVNLDKLKSTIDKIMKFPKNDFSEIVSWLDKHMAEFNDLEGIDHHAMFNLAVFLRIQDSEVFEGITELRNLLEFNKIS